MPQDPPVGSDPPPRDAARSADVPRTLTWAALPSIRQGDGWPNRIVLAVLAIAFGVVYLLTLHPGVDHNDRAEMQHVIPLLGIAHPPGYAIMMVAGKLFTLLPLGGTAAYKLNLLQAVCATLGCLLMYASVRRITGQILPGVVAAGVLGFSTIYWQSALIAEVYSFYGMFLLLGVYAIVRYVETAKPRWLYAAALAMGVCCWNRPSELFIMPAFVLCWLGVFRHFKLGVGRVLISAGLFVVPLAFSLLYFMARYDTNAPYIRDDVLRDEIRGDTTNYDGLANFRNVLSYTLGLKWSEYSGNRRSDDRFELDRKKLVNLLSGYNAIGKNAYAHSPSTEGVSLGLPALILALLGVAFYARKLGWVLLGLGLFAGNTAFYFYHVPSNNLDFISPGIMGVALLAGLGVAAWSRPDRFRPLTIAFQVLCLAAPAFLIWANFRLVDRNTPAEHARQEYCQNLVAAADSLPENAVIISSRQSAMLYRYLYHVEARRTDIRVVNEQRMSNWSQLFAAFQQQGMPVFVKEITGVTPQTKGVDMPGDRLPEQLKRAMHQPKPPLGELGFWRVPDARNRR